MGKARLVSTLIAIAGLQAAPANAVSGRKPDSCTRAQAFVYSLYVAAEREASYGEAENPVWQPVLDAFRRVKTDSNATSERDLTLAITALSRQPDEVRIPALAGIVYAAGRMQDKQAAALLLGRIVAICPQLLAIRFEYKSGLLEPDAKPGDIFDVFGNGLYLGLPPEPMDENPRLSETPYEIDAWSDADLKDLRHAVCGAN